MTPALLHTTCTALNRSTAAAASACTDASSLTSVRTVSASTPRPVMRSAAASSAPSSTSASTTCIPDAANRSDRANPIPLAAPVTTAILPASSFISISSVDEGRFCPIAREDRGCYESAL
jgi:hypothetical protein